MARCTSSMTYLVTYSPDSLNNIDYTSLLFKNNFTKIVKNKYLYSYSDGQWFINFAFFDLYSNQNPLNS